MTALRASWPVLLTLVVFGGRGWADEPPRPAEVRALEVQPASVQLKGSYAAQQLVVTARLDDGRLQDVSDTASYTVADSKVARVSASGRVTPLDDGASEVVIRFGTHEARVAVRAASVHADLPVNFPNQVVPIFTKLGCNSGGCHGKLSGQNGFRLSLLGFDPTLDHDTLVNEGRGRRVFIPAPDSSLLLLKATSRLAHGGGKRLDPDSDEYQIIRSWIAAGAPMGRSEDAVITQVRVTPERRTMTRKNRQQLAVIASYSDGTTQDITRRAQFESNDTEIAAVDAEGVVQTLAHSGEAAVMVRYQGQVAVFRATVPLGVKIPDYDFPEPSIVDRHTHQKWRELGLVPSGLCGDAPFLRRAMLDITGRLPTAERVRAFVADSDPDKRAKLIDALLDSDGYADLFAHKWADILRVSRKNQRDRIYGTFAFHAWIREAMAADLPYDQFARAILSALGDETKSPPTVWYKELQRPEQLVDDTAQVFLGMRLQCAQCHHHPYEKWSQDDYWGFASFFGRLRRRRVVKPGVLPAQDQRDQPQALFTASTGSVLNKRTGQPAVMKPLDGPAVDVPPDDDPRETLVDWMADPKNPFFARAVVNRYWAHFFGRGIVDPLDDLRVTNPPTNPALLDALADDFLAHKSSLKHLVRTLCNSRTYQLSAEPNEFNRHDKQSFARYYPRRLSAEVIYDALTEVIAAPSSFNGLPQDAYAPHRAMMLPDESFQSYFLDVFGRPQRLSACECERVGEANLAQVLHLINSSEVQNKLSQSSARAARLANDPRPDAEKVEELFLAALAHPPKPAQLDAALSHIARLGKDKKTAYENILWGLINTKEFGFNQ